MTLRLGLALSGGGFRATLFHLGVLRYLHDARLLSCISHVTSVSGGSIVGAHLVLFWSKYLAGFDSAVAPLLEFTASRGIRNRISRRFPLFLASWLVPFWRAILPQHVSSTALLIHYYRKWLFPGATLGDLRSSPGAPSILILTTNLTSGRLAWFGGAGYNDGVAVHRCDVLDIATAVAASSAFTGFFPPLEVTDELLGIGPGSSLAPPRQYLTDGGVYDNLGVRGFQDLVRRHVFDAVIVSDASLSFRDSVHTPFAGPLRTALRSADILTQRIYQFEQEQAMSPALDGGCPFLFARISDVVHSAPISDAEASAYHDQHALPHNVQQQLAYLRTDLDQFSPLEANALVIHGYTVARKAVKDIVSGDDACSAPWTPFPAAKEWSLPLDERVRRLRRGGSRRLRPVSLYDGICYLYAVVGAVVVALAMFLPSVVRELHARSLLGRVQPAIARNTIEYQDRLFGTLLSRVSDHGVREDQHVGAIYCTWGTAQACYALLCYLDARGDPRNARYRIFEALHSRFKVRGSASDHWDYLGNTRGWCSRPAQPEERADPALWMLAALAVAIRLEQSSEDGRSHDELLRLRDRFVETMGVADNYVNYSTGAWSTFPSAQLHQQNHAYTTTLAILALLEAKQSGLDCSFRAHRDRLIQLSAEWLSKDFVPGRTAGWRAMGRSSSNEITDAFTLQAYATLMRGAIECTELLELSPDIRNGIAGHLDGMDRLGGDTSERLFVPVGGTEQERSTLLLWRPWALASLAEWLRLQEMGDQAWVERLATAETLRWMLDDIPDYVRKLNTDATFKIAELLYALLRVRGVIPI